MRFEQLHKLLQRLGTAAKRRQLDRDLHDEMEFHLAMRAEKNREAGIPGDDARFAAVRQFGNVTGIRENSRAVWTFGWTETLWQDIRFGARMLIHADQGSRLHVRGGSHAGPRNRREYGNL